MAEKFDLVALGSGSAAATVASSCRKAGWKVALVDSRPFGGTCALRGCDPKKVLVGAAEAVDWFERLRSRSVLRGEVRLDWPELMRFKRTFTDPVHQSRQESFAKAGITALQGRARFAGPSTLKVNGHVLEARHVLIATGMIPRPLEIPGQELLTTSDQFLELDRLPEEVIFVGGGYISFEFAHVAARAGSRAVILHRGETPLSRFDPDLVTRLVEHTRQLGVEIHLRTAVEAVERSAAGFVVRAVMGGEPRSFKAGLVVHGAGRVPEIADLDLANAGVESDERGIRVNEYLQSVSNPAVYAAGDAAASGGPPLTPVAGYEGSVVAANLLEGNHRMTSYEAVPSVVFTLPPLASVGISEREARERRHDFRVNHQDTSGWYASRRIGEEVSASKVLVEEKTGRILGAHLLGHHAEELINLFALALRSGVPAGELKEFLWAYPTHASNVRYMV
jgi:glutathione reductase (NADPH)